MLKQIINGFCAGLLISIGGCVFLACDNKYMGAFFFSVALLSICIKGYSLFTGKVGYIPESHSKDDVSSLLLGLLGNTVATVLIGFLVSLAFPSFFASAKLICAAKLASQNFFSTLLRGILCGVLMYLAVSIYKESKSYIGIVFCIPVFILSGFEHSIADMFYFSVARAVSFKGFLFILTVIVGNTIGGMLLPSLSLLSKWLDKKENEPEEEYDTFPDEVEDEEN